VGVRHYANSAKPVALATAVGAGDATWPVATTAGYPAPPFTVAIDRGTATEEFSLCTAMDGTTFTVDRGFDGASPIGHDAGAPIEHVVGDLDYREANAHVNHGVEHLIICTSATRPSSPDIGQEIFETDTRMKMRFVSTGIWTTDRFLERWWTYAADNLTSTAWTTFFNSGNFQANATGWPGAGLTPSGVVNYPYLMEIKVFGRAGFSVEEGRTQIAIDSPEGVGIWQPSVAGAVDTTIPHLGGYYPTLAIGWKLSWTPSVPNFVLRYNVAPPGENTYLRLAIQARIVPIF
jgi:hypothetical protein